MQQIEYVHWSLEMINYNELLNHQVNNNFLIIPIITNEKLKIVLKFSSLLTLRTHFKRN